MIAIIIRSWKNDRIIEILNPLLGLKQIDYVVLTVNTDVSKGGEPAGIYTSNLLKKTFGSNWQKKLAVHYVANWGYSAALNEGVSELFYRLKRLLTSKDIILNLSVESKITSGHIDLASNLFSNISNLAVVGVRRKILIGESQEEHQLAEKFQDRLQYKVPQNTAAFWRADLLFLGGCFRTDCDFSGLTIESMGEKVPVAGMEDFPLMCHLIMAGYKWAMIEEPMIWDLREIKRDPERWKKNLIKMETQEKVMRVWAQKYFNLELEKLIRLLQN